MTENKLWAEAWQAAYLRGVTRYRGLVRWAFRCQSGSRRQAAALRVVKIAARVEAGVVEARYLLGMSLPRGRGTGPASGPV